ncbi:hypothetical protein O1611_g9713 [Lasiodiplodia mahajangana]|uniref:Uncharacterized protein n=1 Tax=Lasiodiplodia mahajangana TaxID=1108764 RepID=A0ACC2J630_9PEZI|nr:hypothetical protein O1611_g9713 [Lasiodiplodia mahajangana]
MAALGQSSASTSSEVDPLELLDLSEYDGVSYQSPSLSPSATNKMQFARPTPSMTTTPPTMPPNQMLSGPSHQYDQYKQQTPFVPGALAHTLAINEGSGPMSGYNMNYIHPGEEMYDFNMTSSPQDAMSTPSMELDFETQPEPFFFSHAAAVRTSGVPTQPNGVGRMYPGIHQRIAKAQAQQMQQQEIMQRQNQQRRQQQTKQPRPKAPMPTDPIVEQKITQLLSTMRSQKSPTEAEGDSPLLQIPRPKKEEDEMDDDERLLASEEGKKLSSKERRQLRNKVSARAFRSRRKEYIGQLESEIASKANEVNDLRAENRALVDENKRLSDLTRMLLSSPSFSSFLDILSTNPSPSIPVQPQVEQRQPESTQVSKDPNPYSSNQQQQIGMVMVPEQSMDFSMLNLNGGGFGYQPQVFAVLETPELPEINTETLMGKSSNFVGESPASDNDKTDAPSLEAPTEAPISSTIEKPQAPEVDARPVATEKKAADLDGDIFDDDDNSTPVPRPLELDTDGFSAVDVFGGIESEKALARYELVDSSEEEKLACMALKRVERLAASLKATFSSLERLDVDL